VSTTQPSSVGTVVGDGSSVDLKPGSNLPPTESERSGSSPQGSVADTDSIFDD
jgi:hypothetical protein